MVVKMMRSLLLAVLMTFFSNLTQADEQVVH